MNVELRSVWNSISKSTKTEDELWIFCQIIESFTVLTTWASVLDDKTVSSAVLFLSWQPRPDRMQHYIRLYAIASQELVLSSYLYNGQTKLFFALWVILLILTRRWEWQGVSVWGRLVSGWAPPGGGWKLPVQIWWSSSSSTSPQYPQGSLADSWGNLSPPQTLPSVWWHKCLQ